jgi:cyclin-dependent kinase-like
VFRRKQRLFLVFEYVDHTVLKELEENPDGLPWTVVRQHTWQLLRGVEYCHLQNVRPAAINPR